MWWAPFRPFLWFRDATPSWEVKIERTSLEVRNRHMQVSEENTESREGFFSKTEWKFIGFLVQLQCVILLYKLLFEY